MEEIIDKSDDQTPSPENSQNRRRKYSALAIAALILAAFFVAGLSITRGYLFPFKKESADLESKVQQQLLPPTASDTVNPTVETNEIFPETKEASLIAVGDISFSRSVEKMTKNHGLDYPLLKIKDYLRKADIVFGNLEAPITPGREILTGEMIFRSNPGVETTLKDARFNLLSLANNHTMNFGIKGLEDTLKYLKQAGIQYVGAGENDQEAYRPVYLESGGIKFAFLAYQNPKIVPTSYEANNNHAGIAFMNTEKMTEAVKEARQQADFVIVSMHAGDEYSIKPNDSQISFAHSAIDAGADLVIGHHPHVVQTIEEYKNKYIFYSLGNFIFDQMWSQETKRGLAVKIFFAKDKITGISFLPVVIENYCQPRPADADDKESAQILQRLNFSLPNELARPWNEK